MQLPVDTHVYRVSVRLGLIGKKVSPEVAYELLLKLLPPDAQVIHDFHKDLLCHGQRICVYSTPRCWECPLTDLCDYYQMVVRPKEQSTAAAKPTPTKEP
jgi:endonuclease III